MAAAWIAASAALIGAGTGIAGAVAGGDVPDYSKTTRRGIEADLATLPGRRAVEAAARLGTKTRYATGRYRVPAHTESRRVGNRFVEVQVPERIYSRAVRGSEPIYAEADFTGLGQADIQDEFAKKMAASSLETQRKYGPEFVAEARRLSELADPEGTAARKLLHEEILRQAERVPEMPVNQELDRQLGAEVAAGRALDADSQALLDAAIARRAARGDSADVTGIEQELIDGAAGDARLRARLGKATGFQSSGQTPRDVNFRQGQQTMANMGAFLAGQSPQAQFGRLAAAQQGAAPIQPGPALPMSNAGAGFTNAGASAQIAANQVSPWFFGLNAIAQGARVAGSAGFQPFRQN